MDMENIISTVNEYKDQLVATDNNTIEHKDLQIYLALRRKNFVDEAEERRFIKNVERIIRSSLEYKQWISFIKDTLDINICALTGETDEETDDIEIHHHPFTLYDIVQCICDTYISEDKEFCTFDIAAECIQLHFQLKIGFIPLLRSLHKKFHNGFLDIPIDLVHGDYKYILNTYYVREDLKEKVERYESVKNYVYKWPNQR